MVILTGIVDVIPGRFYLLIAVNGKVTAMPYLSFLSLLSFSLLASTNYWSSGEPVLPRMEVEVRLGPSTHPKNPEHKSSAGKNP